VSKGKFSEALHPRAKDGKFSGTSGSARQSRNKKRKSVAGAAIGTAVLPGIGTAAGAGIGYAIASSQNTAGKTPKYKAYSTKKQNKLASKSVKKSASAQKALTSGKKKK
jgi:hypothetical protein